MNTVYNWMFQNKFIFKYDEATRLCELPEQAKWAAIRWSISDITAIFGLNLYNDRSPSYRLFLQSLYILSWWWNSHAYIELDCLLHNHKRPSLDPKLSHYSPVCDCTARLSMSRFHWAGNLQSVTSSSNMTLAIFLPEFCTRLSFPRRLYKSHPPHSFIFLSLYQLNEFKSNMFKSELFIFRWRLPHGFNYTLM